MHLGIPEANLIAETQGSDTAESAKRVGVIMRANGMRSCLAVSDAYHVFRIRKLLEHEGIEVFVAPRPDSRPHSKRSAPWPCCAKPPAICFGECTSRRDDPVIPSATAPQGAAELKAYPERSRRGPLPVQSTIN